PDEEPVESDILSSTTPLSRKETAKLIATGKTAPLPMDEIADALSISDTGFLVHSRYDLSGQGARKAGLTEEQKKLFSYFVPVRGMSEQLVDVLEQDRNCTNRKGTSNTGNLLIVGNKGNGKTVLAVDVVKAIQKQRKIRQGRVAIITGEALNKKKISDIVAKLYGGALIIEKAGKLSERTVAKLNKAMEKDTGEMLIVLEEQRKPLDRVLSSNREFRKKFTSRLEVPIFVNDELVTFGQTYAQENGYRIDEMGILALYSRIDAMQREDHAVTVAEVKDIMDEAMAHSQKVSAKKLVKRVLGKNTDDADRIILTEKDFNI
ncbi:MAG: AAA family ATPase, partial [Clostridiales bacterium]|nr:AAA family ATPase [Clostridiales bacterium]